MNPIIEVNGLWKAYRRGAQQEKYLSLRESIYGALKPGGKKESFWALQDINFAVDHGDSLAIIGKNGAGKSTLLKLLSRITPPTKGEIIIRGRLASLLEVGTGFHAELTGRENIYLNGSILGLGKQEINRQFDTIVDFSGVEAFLETPLKHYSSGMQLRLAFAVAAHLEPEILVIDEVLAVGDSVFQQKCIAKMTEVSQSGRTILFVSHNIQAVKNLCKTGILLDNGIVKMAGQIDDVVETYNAESSEIKTAYDLSELKRSTGKGNLVFKKISFSANPLQCGDSLRINLELESRTARTFRDLDFGVAINDRLNNKLYHFSNRFLNTNTDHDSDERVYVFEFDVFLKSGTYDLVLFLKANDEIQDWLKDVCPIKIEEGNIYGFNNSSGITGLIQPPFKFTVL